tara:strand:- start:2616 stop:3755 length:1140 start_codon:yes stop_codon:yes gene_type:complete
MQPSEKKQGQTVIMIPARTGSKRIKKKNTRLLSGRPLISYVIETSKKTGLPVYVNSDCEIILNYAKQMNCITYKRNKKLTTDESTNDEFMLDFIENIEPDYVLQILPTSPFITIDEINNFLDEMKKVDTLISVKDAQIGCIYKDKPINFNKSIKNPPSQNMEPIKVYATALMGWKCKTFLKNMKLSGAAYHGAEGRTSYFTLKGWSTIDIDNEIDFRTAEAIAQFIPFENLYKPFYYEINSYSDSFVPRVLKDDGIREGNCNQENKTIINLRKLMDENPTTSAWYHTLINTENNSCTILNQMPGEGNRRHYHAKWNEWWLIVRGEWKFEIEEELYNVKEGDLVFIEKGKKHKITAIGNNIASRLAVSRYDVEHIYEGLK